MLLHWSRRPLDLLQAGIWLGLPDAIDPAFLSVVLLETGFGRVFLVARRSFSLRLPHSCLATRDGWGFS
jgi:hypothetical protein